MFECRACASRAVRAIARHVLDAHTIHRPLSVTPRRAPLPSSPSPRRLATTAISTQQQRGDALDAPSAESNAASDTASSTSTSTSTSTSSTSTRTSSTSTSTSTSSNRRQTTENALTPAEEKALRTEVQWLKDPAKFAEHVHYTLRNEQPDKALQLCRVASRDRQCVVAWNHVIDWHVQGSRYTKAVDIYNDMKKRGQHPDSYTYMLLFRSFPAVRKGGGQHYYQLTCRKALRIYQSMQSAKSHVEPSIMHTNAMLRLCSLADDADALWSVARHIPESGPSAADHRTYSILFGAIRHAAQVHNDEASVPPDQYAQSMQRAVDEGRRIWQEVVARWRRGEVAIDEKLVVEMANLLLISKRIEHWDEVLSLVQQTTKVARLIPPVGSPERMTAHVPREADTAALDDPDGWVDSPANDCYKPVDGPATDPANPKRKAVISWVSPGNGILSVLIDACRRMRTPRTAQAYWDEFTVKHHVKPDLANFHSMLSLLAINRSSKKAVEVVQQVHNSGLKPRSKTYRFAMSACRRDWKNHNIMQNATALIDDMQQRLAYPDAYTLESYLSLALHTDEGTTIVRAVNRLDPMVHLLRSRITYGTEGVYISTGAHIAEKASAIRLIKILIGTILIIIKRAYVPRSEFPHWHARRNLLRGLVGRTENNLQEQEEKLLAKHAIADSTRKYKKNLVRQIGAEESCRESRPLNTTRSKWVDRALEAFENEGGGYDAES